jgi:hypothetical protein
MAPPTGIPVMEVLLHLPDIYHGLFHVTSERAVRERPDTNVSQELHLTLQMMC